MNYVGFYINFFILIVWFVINKVFSRMGKGKRSRMLYKELAIFENSEIKGMVIYSDYRKRLRNNLLRKKG